MLHKASVRWLWLSPLCKRCRSPWNYSTSMPRRIPTAKRDGTFEIEGVKPRVYIQDGMSLEASSESSDARYLMKRVRDHYYCTCPAWRNAGGSVDVRTCKHLMGLLGERYEALRVGNGAGKGEVNGKKRATAGPPSRGRKRGEEEEEKEEQVEEKKPAKRGRRAKQVAAIQVEEEEEEEEEEAEKQPAKRIKRATTFTKRANDTSFKPLLAEKWDLEKGRDPTGWHMSEKLDGVRAYWDGGNFRSRTGTPFYAPPWFTKRLPKDITLDGEFFTTRGGFQDCVSIVRTQNNPDAWKLSVTYQIFDVPSMGDEPFEQRLEFLHKTFHKLKIRWVKVLEHTVCEGRSHLFETLDEITKNKGEGLMLRQPGSLYENKRSHTLLKVKRFFDGDAIVRAHERGQGKYSGCTGALRVEMLDDNREPTGKMFKIGSGLTDAQRRAPPKIGSVVIYKYQELSKDGNPRFPTFGGERAD